jgi:hypothetical protein
MNSRRRMWTLKSRFPPYHIIEKSALCIAAFLSRRLPQRDHERLCGAGCRSSHVRNAPLATVGPKKPACRDGPLPDSCAATKVGSFEIVGQGVQLVE